MSEPDDLLQRAYAAARQSRQRQRVSDRPAPEVLAQALDGAMSEAERITTLELALAAGAADELALLQATSAGAPSRPVSRWRWPTVSVTAAAAAAAVVVVTIGLVRVNEPATGGASRPDAAPVFRDGERADGITLLTPSGTLATADSLAASWRAVPGAVRYDIEWLSDAGDVVARFSTRDTVFRSDARAAVDGAAGATGWWVVATLPDGRVRRSDLQLFRRVPQ